MSAPPIPEPVPGVELLSIPVDGAVRDYFRFQLYRFTAATLLGNDKKRWSATEMHGEDLFAPLTRVPLGNFARWICQEPQRYWRDDGVMSDTHAMVEEIVHLLKQEPKNEGLDAAFQQDFIYAAIPGDDYASDVPVTLFLDARLLGDEYHKWYGQRLKAAEGAQTDELCRDLRRTLGAAVKAVRDAYEERSKVQEKLAPYMQKFQGGLQIIDICLDFAKPKEERVEMWKGWEYADREFVSPPPDKAWITNATSFRSEWSNVLVGKCAEVMASNVSQRKIDDAANDVVDQLRRPGAPYLRMLDGWDDLSRGARAELMQTVREAISFALRSEPSRKRLLAGELASIARAVASDETIPSAVEDPKIRTMMTAFDPSLLRSPDDTPLGEKLVDWHSTMSDIKSHEDLVFLVLGLGTPFIFKDIKEGPHGGRYAVNEAIGWALRAALGTTKLPKEKWSDLWVDLNALWSARGKGAYSALKKDRKLFDAHKGALAKANDRSASAFDFIAMAVKIVAVQKAADDLGKEPGSLEKKLETAKAMADFMKSTFELVGSEDDWSNLVNLFEGQKHRISAPHIPKALGIIADGLSFLISVEKYLQVVRRRRGGAAADAAALDAYFDALNFAVTVVGVITGFELLAAGLVIYVVKNMVTNLDSWVPLLPFAGVEEKPAPHRFLENLLKEVLEGESEFEKVCNELAVHDGPGLYRQVDYTHRRLIAAPRAGNQILWDFGGTKQTKLYYEARIFLRKYFSLPAEVASKLAMPCVHG